MAKTKLLIIRHGEVRNPKNVVYGRLPGFPLSKKGRKGIKETSTELKKHTIDAIYSSPITRAIETAGIIGKEINKKTIIEPLLTEVDAYPVQGLSAKFFKERIEPNYYSKKWYAKGVEPAENIQKRMVAAMRKIHNENKNKTVLVVSHGDPIVMLKAYAEGKTFNYGYKIKNYVQKGRYLILEVDDNNKISVV